MRSKLVLFLLLFIPGSAFAQAPVTYRVSFPAPQHHYADVEIVLADLPAAFAWWWSCREGPVNGHHLQS